MTHPKRCEDLLVEMVGFDTVNAAISGRAAPESVLAEFLAAYAEQFKFSVSRLPVDRMGCNLMVSHAVRSDAPWLIFVSHLDTVSAANMTIDPFGASCATAAYTVEARATRKHRGLRCFPP